MLYRTSVHTARRLYAMDDHTKALDDHTKASVFYKPLATEVVAGAWGDIKRQSDVQLHATRNKREYMVRPSLVAMEKMPALSMLCGMQSGHVTQRIAVAGAVPGRFALRAARDPPGGLPDIPVHASTSQQVTRKTRAQLLSVVQDKAAAVGVDVDDDRLLLLVVGRQKLFQLPIRQREKKWVSCYSKPTPAPYVTPTAHALTSHSLLDQDLGVPESVANTLTHKADVWKRFGRSPWVDNDLARRLFEGDTAHRLYHTIRQAVRDKLFQFEVSTRYPRPLISDALLARRWAPSTTQPCKREWKQRYLDDRTCARLLSPSCLCVVFRPTRSDTWTPGRPDRLPDRWLRLLGVTPECAHALTIAAPHAGDGAVLQTYAVFGAREGHPLSEPRHLPAVGQEARVHPLRGRAVAMPGALGPGWWMGRVSWRGVRATTIITDWEKTQFCVHVHVSCECTDRRVVKRSRSFARLRWPNKQADCSRPSAHSASCIWKGRRAWLECCAPTRRRCSSTCTAFG